MTVEEAMSEQTCDRCFRMPVVATDPGTGQKLCLVCARALGLTVPSVPPHHGRQQPL